MGFVRFPFVLFFILGLFFLFLPFALFLLLFFLILDLFVEQILYDFVIVPRVLVRSERVRSRIGYEGSVQLHFLLNALVRHGFFRPRVSKCEKSERVETFLFFAFGMGDFLVQDSDRFLVES